VATKGSAMLKFFITFLVVMSVVAAMIYESPFLDHEKWKENVKVYSLILAVTSGLLNYVTFVENELEEFPMGRNGGRNLSILVFIMSMGLFFILITSFWRVLVRGAEAEAKAAARRRRRLQRIVVDLPREHQVRYQAGGNPMVYKTLQDHEQSLKPASKGAAGDTEPGAAGSSISPATGLAARRKSVSRIAKLMMQAGNPLAMQLSGVKGGSHAANGSAAPADAAARGLGVAPASWDKRRNSIMSSALGGPNRTRISRRTSTAAPALARDSGEKWRKAFESANAQLSVMSAKERQRILREAARERAYVKRTLW